MATYLSAVNSVLTRLREPVVASVSQDGYSEMIGEFVKQALSEMEDAWDWGILRTTVQVVTEADVFAYALTGAGENFHVLQCFEDTLDYELFNDLSYKEMNRRLLANTIEPARPQHYDFNGRDANDNPLVNLFPIPDGSYTLNFNTKVKTVLTDDTDTILVTALPVVLRATQLAVEERGDDNGPSPQSLGGQAELALNDAIAYDTMQFQSDMIWEVV